MRVPAICFIFEVVTKEYRIFRKLIFKKGRVLSLRVDVDLSLNFSQNVLAINNEVKSLARKEPKNKARRRQDMRK